MDICQIEISLDFASSLTGNKKWCYEKSEIRGVWVKHNIFLVEFGLDSKILKHLFDISFVLKTLTDAAPIGR